MKVYIKIGDKYFNKRIGESMIEQRETNNFCHFVLICDNCGKEIEGFDCIDSVCDYIESEGWVCEEGTRLDLTEGLMDICPKCMEE